MKIIDGLLTTVGSAALLATAAHAAVVNNEYVCEDAYMEKAFDCATDAVQIEKNRLNKVYMTAYRTLSPTQKHQLDKEQLAWLKSRNNQCNFEHDGPMNNSVVWAMIGADLCVANETKKRSSVIINKFHMK